MFNFTPSNCNGGLATAGELQWLTKRAMLPAVAKWFTMRLGPVLNIRALIASTMEPTSRIRRRARNLASAEDLARLLPWARPERWYRPGKTVTVADRMQTRYRYRLTARRGRDFDPGFRPQVSPRRMLQLGVFEGKYLNDCVLELPREWYAGALRRGRLCPGAPDPARNCFGLKSRLSLRHWRREGWIPAAPGDRDVRGWFQWYCRYWLGRRQPAVDQVQIARWRAFVRHRAQVVASAARLRTRPDPHRHRPRQRQALLQWAYNPYC